MLSADAVVVGGGPAGSAAATTLARAGRSVLLVDKATFPRDKCCGDGLTTDALRRLERLGLDPANVASWQAITDMYVRTPAGLITDLPLPRSRGSFAAVARRADLDAALLEVAAVSGVVVHQGRAVASAKVSDRGGSVELTVDGLGTLRARYVIAADGMWSPLRKMLRAQPRGEGSYLGEWYAFRQYFAKTSVKGMWVIFEPDVLPGYVWAFQLPDGRANVGFGQPRHHDAVPIASMRRLWADILERPHIRAILGDEAEAEETPRAWPIPGRVTDAPLTAAGGRVLFAGDAARAADPLTGEGIAQALETGELAAKAVIAAGPNDSVGAAWRYRKVINAGMAVDHRMSVAGANLLRRAQVPDLTARLVRATGTVGRRNFARWVFEDYPRAVLATPRRLGPSLFWGPGAYR